MKRFAKSMLGVTLLEIMLVLAIAAMIIVMSVRYYQSANASQQATQVLNTITAILASADALSQGTGTYSGVTSATITPLLSNVGGLKTPWGSTMTITGATNTFSVQIPNTPSAVCGLIAGRLQGDPHYTTVSPCPATGTSSLGYTYQENPPNL